ncbi:hypothetical protein HSEST_0093 [Halapricum desulfuricans]|uniref:Uncharacterized protein n=1 Tax=Halapricum desulfuricans TaxID=2841257 RepID=A0A897NN21_9EURY|nr:hypothetical protein HSEST_0093 [Halapricum desulfuricans]
MIEHCDTLTRALSVEGFDNQSHLPKRWDTLLFQSIIFYREMGCDYTSHGRETAV